MKIVNIKMINRINQAPQMIFSLVRKAFSYQEGALAFIATPIGIGVEKLISLVFNEVPEKDLLMPILLFACCLVAFFLVSAIDFYTGISASRKEHITKTGNPRGYIQSDKLWSSVWKIQGVVMVASLLVLFTYIFIAIGHNTIASIFLGIIPIFFIVVILFDVVSIGENHYRRYKTKPDFYSFVEDISKAIRKSIINKIIK